MKPLNRGALLTILGLMLLCFWLVGNLYQINIGIADNGDWYRSIWWFTPGPVGFDDLNISSGTPTYLERYYTYWLPYWHLDFRMPDATTINEFTLTSNYLLWLPGILAGKLPFSQGIIALPIVSIFPRILVGVGLFNLFLWIKNGTKTRKILLLTLMGLPLVLLTTSPGYSAYLNTFYQENGDLVFFLLLFSVLIWFISNPESKLWFSLLLILTFLLSISKTSHFFWSVVMGFFLILFPQVRRFKKRWLWVVLVVVSSLAILGLNQSSPRLDQNKFNRIYTGYLPFSADPAESLKALSLSGTDACLDNLDYFSPQRLNCIEALHLNQIDSEELSMLLREPDILWKQMDYVSSQFQKVTLQGMEPSTFNLGNYAPWDQRPHDNSIFNLWVNFKENLFPKGGWFWAFIVLTALFSIWQLKQSDSRSFGKLELLLIILVLIEMVVAMMGDGKYELVKHLFLANLVFDILLMTVFSSGTLTIINLFASLKIHLPH